MATKTVAEKMHLKSGMNIGFFNAPDNIFQLLGQLPDDVECHTNDSTPDLDVLVAFIEHRAMLEKNLPKLKQQIKNDGALWIAYHKGSSSVDTDINRNSIYAFAGRLDLKGVAMVSINENWSGFRFKKI